MPRAETHRSLAPRILLVDSTGRDREQLRAQLRSGGHDVAVADDATAAVDRLEQQAYDLVLTEHALRDMSGVELAQYVRRHPNGRLTRVVIFSDRSDPAAVAHALNSGIDDYLFKPCREEELLARIGAALRRPAVPAREDVLEVGPIRLDKLGHTVTVGSAPLELAPAEFRLMAYFMEHPGRVLGRHHLLEKVWRRRAGIGERTVDVHVRRLRAALEPHRCESLLQTVRGFGYRFG
ncbi:MAG: winged helix-turn-helix domain-containing protein [Chromatiales bacterium]|nr:winged helix-turn-helix domain-containing protein [Chromatiales bacterium]